ncbi:hypothetical protein LP420_24645 [Massilia sp. B-10]|nr:hypothetical protein LP420_24645 [Massilia sp. B-10]
MSNAVGPGHKLTGSPLGMLTVPVSTQIANHLTKTGGKFSGTEVVFVTVGGNDALALLGQLSAAATAAQPGGRLQPKARVGAQTYVTTLVGLLAAGATDPQAAAVAIGTAAQTEAGRSKQHQRDHHPGRDRCRGHAAGQCRRGPACRLRPDRGQGPDHGSGRRCCRRCDRRCRPCAPPMRPRTDRNWCKPWAWLERRTGF